MKPLSWRKCVRSRVPVDDLHPLAWTAPEYNADRCLAGQDNIEAAGSDSFETRAGMNRALPLPSGAALLSLSFAERSAPRHPSENLFVCERAEPLFLLEKKSTDRIYDSTNLNVLFVR
jgi:hypothetical protein